MYNHRGQPTGTNYRPTPRVARNLSQYINKTSGLAPGETISYTDTESQQLVNDYRWSRDAPFKDKENKELIQDSLTNRNDDSMKKYKKLHTDILGE